MTCIFYVVGNTLNAPDVGVSKDDLSNAIIGSGKQLMSIATNAVKTSLKAEKKLRKDTEKYIEELTRGVNKTSKLYQKHAKPALEAILNTRVELKAQRNKLNEIVYRVMFNVKDFKAIANSIFNGEVKDEAMIDDLLKHQVAITTDLISQTKKIIDEANKVYKNVRESFSQVELSMSNYVSEIRKLRQAAEEKTAAHDKRVKVARASVYSCKYLARIILSRVSSN